MSKRNTGAKSPPKTRTPTRAEFVVAYQQSETAKECAEKLGIPGYAGWCNVTAGQLRRNGVELKKLPMQRRESFREPLDVHALNEIIRNLESKEQKS